MWLPDTNFWIHILKQPHGVAAERFRLCQSTDLRTSVIVWAELLHGAEKYGLPQQRRQIIHRLLEPFECLPVDLAVAAHYAEIRHNLESRGKVIGPFDLLLAATAMAHNLTVVTSNTGEFNRVDGLRVEDWTLVSQ
jgi:tRNA(fMet)-specific endonuclease VapC